MILLPLPMTLHTQMGFLDQIRKDMFMNNEYSEPSLEVIEVEREDVVTASLPDTVVDPNNPNM